ncbi:MAG: hypothetical protein MJ118_04735 [Clostridia bacterium]|nr:hypothetical protein [Clostridia bacterium]
MKRKQKTEKPAKSIAAEEASKTDPMGMWTGRPADELDLPVQDADDL